MEYGSVGSGVLDESLYLDYQLLSEGYTLDGKLTRWIPSGICRF